MILYFSHLSMRAIFVMLFCYLAVLDLRVGHTMDVLSPFISVLCHSHWLFHREFCPCIDVVHSALRGLPHLHAPGIVPCISSFPGNFIVSSWCDHSTIALLWQCLTVNSSFVKKPCNVVAVGPTLSHVSTNKRTRLATELCVYCLASNRFVISTFTLVYFLILVHKLSKDTFVMKSFVWCAVVWPTGGGWVDAV